MSYKVELINDLPEDEKIIQIERVIIEHADTVVLPIHMAPTMKNESSAIRRSPTSCAEDQCGPQLGGLAAANASSERRSPAQYRLLRKTFSLLAANSMINFNIFFRYTFPVKSLGVLPC